MRKLAFIGLTCTLALAAPRSAVPAEGRDGYVLIVNPSNPITNVERKFVEEAFLKKTTRWPSDEVIRPVDLVPNSTVRRHFTEDVLKRPVEAVKGYWQQRIFSGRDVPPPELSTDGDVVKYVLQYEGGIGYVSANAELNGARVVAVE